MPSHAPLINPRREKGEPRLAGPGALFVNPAEAKRAANLAKAAGWRRHFLFHSQLHVAPGGRAWMAGPAVGAPMAVLCLEKLIALGARTVVACGWGGTLSPTVEIGQVVLPTRAVSGEGTSAHYPLAAEPTAAPALRAELAELTRAAGFVTHHGPVWTTDAPYRETGEQVHRYHDQGVLAVDMECAALLQVAAFRGVALAMVLLISDSLAGGVWQPAFRGPSFKAGARRLTDALFVGHLAEKFVEQESPCNTSM